jgi:pimeloyl-ACP methyl ester carboxylesterase
MFHHSRLSVQASTIVGITLAACVSGCSAPSGKATDADGVQIQPSGPSGQQVETFDPMDSRSRGANDIVLVHGAWADGSGWSAVIEQLQQWGYSVQAVQLAEEALAGDADLVRRTIAKIPRPVVVVGHSYGGAVISEATAGAANVTSLVFIAAVAPDEGETIGDLAALYPPTPLFQHLIVDALGYATVSANDFVAFFAPDVPDAKARVLAAAQHSIQVSILGTPATAPGWRTIPSYYQVSKEDQAVSPDLERFLAQRMHAHTIELSSSHASLVSHPEAVARLIDRAAHHQ